MPHESTVDHDGSELSADDEADSPISVTMETLSPSCPGSLISPATAPHVPHVRPETPKQVTHHLDDDDDDEDDVNNVDDSNAADEADDLKVVNGSVSN